MNKQEYIVFPTATGEDIREMRKSMKLTQREFGQLIGAAKSTIERWEAGTKPVAGPITLLLEYMKQYPEYIEAMKIPAREYPQRMWYMYRERVCTLIDVNELERKVKIKNYTDHLMFRAFGRVEKPTYEMYEEFLESRCFPRTRDKMKLILKELDIPFYDPMLIIEKTQGRMAEDEFWLKLEERL